jgi:hypothetical protein
MAAIIGNVNCPHPGRQEAALESRAAKASHRLRLALPSARLRRQPSASLGSRPSVWLDASPAYPGRRDAYVHVACATCPRFEVRSCLNALDFTLVSDFVRVTMHEDAPAFMERLVEAVDFEADLGIGVQSQQCVRSGTEDNGLSS